jgi:hypothetical protein
VGDSNRTTNFLDVLNRRPWTDRAACKDLDDKADPMFPDLPTSPNRPRLESGALLLPLLICERCPVRHECLTESLEPVWYTRREETDELREVVSQQWVDGVWGGTLLLDRWAVRHLPVADAVEQLEASYAKRLRVRIAAYRHYRSHYRSRGRNVPFFKAVDAMLAERRRTVTRFDLGNPGGPGRGHRGPIALLAAELGVSRSTAWRRLRAQEQFGT